jgi:hypothetical protein
LDQRRSDVRAPGSLIVFHGSYPVAQKLINGPNISRRNSADIETV